MLKYTQYVSSYISQVALKPVKNHISWLKKEEEQCADKFSKIKDKTGVVIAAHTHAEMLALVLPHT